MSSVVRAWKLEELLDIPRFALKREEIERGIVAAQQNQQATEVLDNSEKQKK